MAKTRKKELSAGHLEALAAGREQARAVGNYLEALELNKPRRGRRRTPESVEKRLAVLEEEIPAAEPLKRLVLIQERYDLTAELAAFEPELDISELESDFVAQAKAYSERKGISYAAWREIGVAPPVLKAAGISRAN